MGTREHALGDSWMLSKAEELKRMCEDAVKAEPARKLECEVWRQEGNGSHRCAQSTHECIREISSSDLLAGSIFLESVCTKRM